MAGAVQTRPLKQVVKISIFQHCFPSFGLSCFIQHSSCRATNGHRPSTMPSRCFYTRDATSRRVISPPLLGIVRFVLVLIRWWQLSGSILWVEHGLDPFPSFLNVSKAYHDAVTHNITDGTGGLDGSIFFELDWAEVSDIISTRLSFW